MKNFDADKATDTQLLIRFEEGMDQRAFAEIVRRHGPMVLATTRRVLASNDDCHDAFQATFLALAKSVGRLRKKEALAGWLHRAANLCAKRVRLGNARWNRKSERMKERLGNQEGGDKRDPSLSIANEELEQILDEELARLPEKLHAAVVLCDLEGLSQTQAAARLGIAASTVNDHVAKGRKFLRERLVRRGVTLTLAGLASCVASSSECASAMTSALVADTTAKATLFAAGQTAAEIGVSDLVIHSAEKVITAMMKAKLLAVVATAVALLLFAGAIGGLMRGSDINVAKAGTLYNESFQDGDLSTVLANGETVTWGPSPLQPGSINASSGDLVLGPNAHTNPTVGVAVGLQNVLTEDASVRTQLRVTETGGSALVNARNVETANGIESYFAGVGFVPEFGGSILVAGRAVAGQPPVFYETTTGAPVLSLPYDVRQNDTVIQLDVIGDEVRVWTWLADGSPMPNQPQFDIVDGTLTGQGFVAAVLTTNNSEQATGNSEAIFRYIHVADMPIHEIVPEPDAATLGLFALAGLAFFTWRRRRF